MNIPVKNLSKIRTEKEYPPIPETELHRTRNSKGEKFYNEYKYIKFLGEGAFSKVKLVCKNNQQYAMKVIDKKLLRNSNKGFSRDENGDLLISSMLENALKEIAILKKCHHRNIIKLYEILHDDEKEKLYLILEYCPKGTLMLYDEETETFEINKNYYIHKDFYNNLSNENTEMIEKEKEKIKIENYSEDEIRHFLREIIKGLSYLHHNGIIHRDIKPDNILISNSNTIKITDFNVSSLLKDKKDDNIGKKIEGSLYFRAPETCILDENDESFDLRGKPLDIWALGVTAYILAYKQFPFYENNYGNMLGLFDIIEKGIYHIPNNRMSKGFIKFLNMCLEKNPEKRASVWKLKKMKWINEKGDSLDKEIFPPKIIVSITDVKGSIGFFNKQNLISKVILFFSKQSINGNTKKNGILSKNQNYKKTIVIIQKTTSSNSIDKYNRNVYINNKKKKGINIKDEFIDSFNNNIENNKVKLYFDCNNTEKFNKSNINNLIDVINLFNDEKYRSKDIKQINLGSKEPDKMNKIHIDNLINIINLKLDEMLKLNQ